MKKLNKKRAYCLIDMDRASLIAFCDLVNKQSCSGALLERDYYLMETRLEEEFVIWKDGRWIISRNVDDKLITYTYSLFEERTPLEIKYIDYYIKLLSTYVDRKVPKKLIVRYFTSDCVRLQDYVINNLKDKWRDLAGIGVIDGCTEILRSTVNNGNLKS